MDLVYLLKIRCFFRINLWAVPLKTKGFEIGMGVGEWGGREREREGGEEDRVRGRREIT
jgi:hypothetical protein